VNAPAEFIRPVTRTGRGLRAASGLVFTGLLVLAPLNFGSTRAGGSGVIAAGCAGAVLLWVAARWCGGPRVPVPPAAVACVALFFVAALPWITGLARPTSVADFTRQHFARVAARWPYSIVWHTPASALAFTVALAAAVLPLIDLARSRPWALVFSVALVATAVAVALLALLQNFTHATGIYWRHDGRMPGNFSGTFYHHTAAGAYYNTAWPLAFALAWLARDRPVLATLAGLATAILLAAHGSHVSRFPQVAALLVAPVLLRKLQVRGTGRWLLVAGGAALAVLLVAVSGRVATIGARWQQVWTQPAVTPAAAFAPESAWPALVRDDLFIPHTSRGGALGDRGEGWRTALRAIAERPFTGHGPGNWMGAASHHTADPFVRTFFQFLQFAHQDLLQFAVEWGVPAALAWSGLLLGAIVAALRARIAAGPLRVSLGIAAACALAAVLLQSQLDFPLQMPALAFNALVLAALAWAAAPAAPVRAPLPA
jgi:O-antigen ligase